MIIYRPHRGSLEESMRFVKTFDDEKAMKKYIVDDWGERWGAVFGEDNIVILEKTLNDDRIGWKNVRMVCTTRIRPQKYKTPLCIGFCATI